MEVPHGPLPVNEFCEPTLFPSLYPTLYPYGIGGFEDKTRQHVVSLKRHASHLLRLGNMRFQRHRSFLFVVFNILQRREVLLRSSLKVKKESSPATLSRPTVERDPQARPPSRLSEVETARPSSSEPHRSTHSRSRRKSPVYTSSEDESSPSTKVKTEAKVKTESTTKDRSTKEKKPKYRPIFRPRTTPLPIERDALNKYYRLCYRQYTILNSQKTKFLLKYQDVVNEGEEEYLYISDSDSDSPLELMDPDITAAFMADLKAVEEELRKIIRQIEILVQSGESE